MQITATLRKKPNYHKTKISYLKSSAALLSMNMLFGIVLFEVGQGAQMPKDF